MGSQEDEEDGEEASGAEELCCTDKDAASQLNRTSGGSSGFSLEAALILLGGDAPLKK